MGLFFFSIVKIYNIPNCRKGANLYQVEINIYIIEINDFFPVEHFICQSSNSNSTPTL